MRYTKDELMSFPLARLRLIDVVNAEDEKVLQEVVSLKMSQMPSDTPVQRIDVPDIKTKEEEERWQKVIDERNAKLKPQVEVKADESGIDIKIEQKEEELKQIQEEVKSVTKCDKCEFVGKNANGLRLHSKKHAIK